MSRPVQWVETLADVRPGDAVDVVGDEAHHAVAVRRIRVGEQVVLTDGQGLSVAGTVTETGKRRLTVRADDIDTSPEPAPAFTVVQALPKGDRGELAVELLSEVGVASIVPWAAARSVAVWRGERAAKSLARWRSTAREAAKQSRRSWFPRVADLATTDDVVRLVGEVAVAVVLHESADLPLSSVDIPSEGTALVVVGPEGGLTDEEVAGFRMAGAHVVRLGREVLRTSTAGVVAVSALMSRTARWR